MGFSHGNSKTNILPKRNNTKRYYLIITFVCFGFSKILFAQEVIKRCAKPEHQDSCSLKVANLDVKINVLFINVAQMLPVHLGCLCPMLFIIVNPTSISFGCN